MLSLKEKPILITGYNCAVCGLTINANGADDSHVASEGASVCFLHIPLSRQRFDLWYLEIAQFQSLFLELDFMSPTQLSSYAGRHAHTFDPDVCPWTVRVENGP